MPVLLTRVGAAKTTAIRKLTLESLSPVFFDVWFICCDKDREYFYLGSAKLRSGLLWPV